MKYFQTFGSDPEAFLTRANLVVGSERLIRPAGVKTQFGRIIRDGVQLELNPIAGTIGVLRYNIGNLLNTLLYEARRRNLEVSFAGLVDVGWDTLQGLSPSCRVLGCQPSFNVYGRSPLTVDPVTYTKRSAGGHVHMSLPSVLMKQREQVVYLLDALVGNTCVLLDRDPGAAERRENYGRAGEYRTPDYGLEYRTISNFWLRDPVLMELVFTLTAFTLDAMQRGWGLPGFDFQKVQQAINTNNAELAAENFREVTYGLKNFPLQRAKFLKLSERMQKDSIDTIFNVSNAGNRWAGDSERWQQFLKRIVG